MTVAAEGTRGPEGTPPATWCDALEAEYRTLYGGPAIPPDAASDPHGRLHAMHERMHERQPSALCLSGRGIRSATFALGVLQGLAHLGVLNSFDYLSTVSGGGYTGGWFTAWLQRAGSTGRSEVFGALDPARAQLDNAADHTGRDSSPVERVRLTCRYLAPRGGLLSEFGNPASATTWQRSEPRLGVGPLSRELLGITTEQNPYVYLSDGGHYENLGLWEMVARRCRFIVVSDGGCDPDYTFDDLSNAVRRIRLDLGIPIHFAPLDITRAGQGRSNPHGALGVVRYSVVDGPAAPDGVILSEGNALGRRDGRRDQLLILGSAVSSRLHREPVLRRGPIRELSHVGVPYRAVDRTRCARDAERRRVM